MDDVKRLVESITSVLEKKGAEDIMVINVEERTIIADYFIIASGRSSIQVKALCDNVEEALAETGVFPKRKEGYSYGRWIVLDYLNILVHIFHKEEREFYNLERLWSDPQNTRFVSRGEPAVDMKP